LNRPSEHLNKYPVLFEAIQKETAEENPDGEFLVEAVGAMKNLQAFSQLRVFQTAMGKGPTSKLEWHSLVPEDVIATTPKQVAKRQE
jgi:RHO1 GDP-GTP exchange protein 1/2